MPKTCIVQHCGSVSRSEARVKEGLTFHRLPNNDILKQKWMDNIQRTNYDGSPWRPYKHATVCSRHFLKTCFHGPKLGEEKGNSEEDETEPGKKKPMRRILFPNAIPTENMGLRNSRIVHTSALMPLPPKKRTAKMSQGVRIAEK